MTNRARRVSELIKHELAEIIRKDFEFSDALVTIHEVDMTPDLKQAHVYIGVIGREDLQEDAMHKLRKASQSLTAKLSRRVVLKNTPSLHFKLDNSIERGVRVLNIIEEIDTQTPPEEPPYPNADRLPRSVDTPSARKPGEDRPRPASKKSRRPIVDDEEE